MTFPRWFHHPEKDSMVAQNAAHADELADQGFTPNPADSKQAAGRTPAPAAAQTQSIATPPAPEACPNCNHMKEQLSRMGEKLSTFSESANQRVIDLESQVAKLQVELAHAGMEALNGLGEAVGEAADSR